MSNVSLRLPYLIYLSLGSMMLGILVAPVVREVPGAAEPAAITAPAAHAHRHDALDVAVDAAPEIAMTISKDPLSGWNITLALENFTFTPDAVNGPNVANTGHAHLYVNGEKAARLYSAHYHLGELPPGQHEITVALNSNDHSVYRVAGRPIEARAVVMQGPAPSPGG